MNKGGPITEESKKIVRWNAARHGIRSPAPVIPGIERKEDREEHSDGVLESLQPKGHLETVLVERDLGRMSRECLLPDEKTL